MNKWFNSFATRSAELTGRSWAFIASVILLVVWAISGPLLGFSDTWQLFINTITTVITYLMVFIIQNAANRSDYSTQIKLDLILQMLGVDDEDVRELENLDDKRLEEILKEVQSGKTASEGTNLVERKSRSKKANTR